MDHGPIVLGRRRVSNQASWGGLSVFAKGWPMTENIQHELITRRTAFSLFGLTAAFSLALPVTLSALSDAEAQTAGMERRDDRREGRQDRRDARRGKESKPESTGSSTGTK